MEKIAFGFNQYYTVVWWNGGSEIGEWKEASTFKNKTDAYIQQTEITISGHAAYVYDRWQLQNDGMPQDPPPKWDFKTLKWKET